VDTDDVVQAYIKDEESPYAVPNPCLCAFKRVPLKAGETALVLMDIAPRAFSVVDDEGNRAITSGRFTLYVATSQPDAVSERLTGNKPVTLDVRF
jgi:beta-glucosidase